MEDPQPALLRKMRGSGTVLQMRSRGNSMAPLIRTGSVVTLVFDPIERIRTGDIVLFLRKSCPVLHRVVARREQDGTTLLREKGDHQPFSSWVEADQVLARVIRVETDRHVFCPDTPRGRMSTRFILLGARVEMAMYAGKRRLLGSGTSGAGRAVVRAGMRLRAGLLKVLGGQGRG